MASRFVERYNRLPVAARAREFERVHHVVSVAERWAGRKGKEIKPKDALALLGGETPSWGRPLKRRKFRQIREALVEQEARQQIEIAEKERLEAWLASNGRQVTVSWDAIGHTRLHTPTLVKGRERFPLEKILSVADVLEGKVANGDIAKLRERAEFWERYGITSGPELHEYLQTHFAREQMKFGKGKKASAEMQWLRLSHPGDYTYLEQLQKIARVDMVRVRKTPKIILETVRGIATGSQGNMVSTWIGDIHDHDVVITAADREQMRQDRDRVLHSGRVRRLESKGNHFKADIKKEAVEEEYRQGINKGNESVNLIREFMPLFMSLDVNTHDPAVLTRIQKFDPQFRERLRTINDHMAELGLLYGVDKIRADDTENMGKEALKVAGVVLALTSIGVFLEESLGMGQIAKFVTAMGDDLAFESINIVSLLAAGVKMRELYKRAPWLLGGGTLAGYLAWNVEHWQENVDPHLAGAAFMFSAVALSFATTLATVAFFDGGYRKLAREGKLRDTYAPVGKADLQRLRKDASIETTEDLWRKLEQIFRSSGDTVAVIKEKRIGFDRFTAGKDMDTIREQLYLPARFGKALRRGVSETVNMNDTMRGVTIGVSTAPLVGAVAGPVMFGEIPVRVGDVTVPPALIYGPMGSYESDAGMATVGILRATAGGRWRRRVNKEVRKIERQRRTEQSTTK